MQALETHTQIDFSPLFRRYTLEEFWALPERADHARYNLIWGISLYGSTTESRLTGRSVLE
jgi:hypothetical protein